MLVFIILVVLVGQLSCHGADIHLNEIKEKDLFDALSKYDFNNDGIISEQELEISLSDISDDLSKFQPSEDKKTQTQEIKAPDDEEKYINSTWTIILTAVLGAAVTFLFILILTRKRSNRQREKQREEIMLSKKEEWLNRIASSDQSGSTKQRKHLVGEIAEEPELIAAKLRKTTFENSYEKSLPSACKQRKTTFESLENHGNLYDSADSSENEDKENNLPHKDTGHFVKDVSKVVNRKTSKPTHLKHSHVSRHLKNNDALSSNKHANESENSSYMNKDLINGQKRETEFQDFKPEQSIKDRNPDSENLKDKTFSQKDEQVSSSKSIEIFSSKTEGISTNEGREILTNSTEDVSANEGREISTNSSAEDVSANEGSDDKEEVKSTDKNKLIAFLSQVLDCEVNVAEDVRMRYSLGKLDVNAADLPTSVVTMSQSLTVILQKIVPRQISPMKYAIKCFDCCEQFDSSYHDELVDAASDWLKMTCVSIIFKNIKKEFVASSHGDDWWSDLQDKDSATESAVFLWRLAGWADDEVFVSSSLLSRLLESDKKSVMFVKVLLQTAGRQLTNVKRIDEVIYSEGRTLNSLDVLLSNSRTGPILATIMQREVERASEGLGSYFEKNSVFGSLLGISTVPTKLVKSHTLNLSGNAVIPFSQLRGFPRVTEVDVRHIECAIQDGVERCQAVVYNALKSVMMAKSSREHALSWLSAVICLNDLRSPAVLETDAQLQACCSDGFMLNFCSVLLDFFIPIFGDCMKLKKIDLGYSTSEACRLNYDFETCMAGGQIVSEKQKRLGPLPTELQSVHSFISECYHLTQRALSIGVIPAISHYNRMHQDFSIRLKALKGTPQEKQVKNLHVLMTLMWDASLINPELARKISMFYLAQGTLLMTLMEEAGQNTTDSDEKLRLERKAFSKIPEFCIKDMAIWFRFAASHALYVHSGVLSGLSLSPFVDCCVTLLERPDLLPGPIPASKIVSALYHFVQTSENTSTRGTGWGSGVMSDLASMVHTCPSVKSKLGPALLRAYISVDVVEGLDVDKDEFDKYSARSEIGKLIQHLWHRADCRASIASFCHTDLFQNFLGAILDTLLYMLHDSLSRLANIRQIEIAKDDQQTWNALSPTQIMEKEQFLKNEEHVASGFMSLANETLSFIEMLTKADEVSLCFTERPLAQRSVSVICGFLESLCGTKAKDFKVKNMDKYNFSPRKLLSQIVSLILRISLQETSPKHVYLVSMVNDPDFEIGNLEKALSVMSTQELTDEETIQQLSHLIKQLNRVQSECRTENQMGSEVESDWLTKLATIETDHEALVTEYTVAMTSYRLSAANIQEAHSYHGNIQEFDPRSSKVKMLMKEMKQLQHNLPVHPDAAIFIKQDEDRMDVMRAVVTGPVGTPYSLGCFMFDVYFPTSYPNIPPLIKLITTGNGTVRFNPNLYSDGKVCLSLLGTWHGGNASEKWNPGKSTLYQVLLSIQSIILVPDPVFNEPGYEGRQETSEGQQQSELYNCKIRLQTMRYAILGILTNPPTGTADIVKKHFALQKEAILKQCYHWLQECEDEDLKKRFRQTLKNIYTQINCLTATEECEKNVF